MTDERGGAVVELARDGNGAVEARSATKHKFIALVEWDSATRRVERPRQLGRVCWRVAERAHAVLKRDWERREVSLHERSRTPQPLKQPSVREANLARRKRLANGSGKSDRPSADHRL
jgi:hypothetical protein